MMMRQLNGLRLSFESFHNFHYGELRRKSLELTIEVGHFVDMSNRAEAQCASADRNHPLGLKGTKSAQMPANCAELIMIKLQSFHKKS
jgi:hypothetical protein